MMRPNLPTRAGCEESLRELPTIEWIVFPPFGQGLIQFVSTERFAPNGFVYSYITGADAAGTFGRA